MTTNIKYRAFWMVPLIDLGLEEPSQEQQRGSNHFFNYDARVFDNKGTFIDTQVSFPQSTSKINQKSAFDKILPKNSTISSFQSFRGRGFLQSRPPAYYNICSTYSAVWLYPNGIEGPNEKTCEDYAKTRGITFIPWNLNEYTLETSFHSNDRQPKKTKEEKNKIKEWKRQKRDEESDDDWDWGDDDRAPEGKADEKLVEDNETHMLKEKCCDDDEIFKARAKVAPMFREEGHLGNDLIEAQRSKKRPRERTDDDKDDYDA